MKALIKYVCLYLRGYRKQEQFTVRTYDGGKLAVEGVCWVKYNRRGFHVIYADRGEK